MVCRVTLSTFDIRTRWLVNRSFVEDGHAPAIHQLAELQGCTLEEIISSLKRLQDDHRLLLYPETADIWIAHPFSASPSNYWVESGDRGWWGNCGFCSLGIAAMLKEDTSIHARLGSERTPITISISGMTIDPNEYQLHVPLPIARWHDNLVYTCGNAHYFESAVDIDDWCLRHRIERGQAVPIFDAWNLAMGWYGNYLAPNWRPRGNTETNLLLFNCGLDSAFWRLPDD